jgi:metal-dependent amidase/aminoacylase/carboxypeptidase family protein
LDALPVLEEMFEDTKAFLSQTSGKMHACGHDAHMVRSAFSVERFRKKRRSQVKNLACLGFGHLGRSRA